MFYRRIVTLLFIGVSAAIIIIAILGLITCIAAALFRGAVDTITMG